MSETLIASLIFPSAYIGCLFLQSSAQFYGRGKFTWGPAQTAMAKAVTLIAQKTPKKVSSNLRNFGRIEL
jgi:hypothetical protein